MNQNIITITEDDHSGFSGMLLKGMKPIEDTPFIMTEGIGIAHDLVEHANGVESIGSVEDELIAIGGIWQVRGRWGDVRRGTRVQIYDHEQITASEISQAFEYQWWRGDVLEQSTYVPEHVDELGEIRHIVDLAYDACEKFLMNDCDSGYGYTEAEEVVEDYLSKALRYMAEGIHLHNEKYGSGTESNSQFWSIAEAVDPFCNNFDDWDWDSGDELLLTWGDGDASCVQIHTNR